MPGLSVIVELIKSAIVPLKKGIIDENKNGKRWVIYANTIDASKIPVEWYSWIHFTPNKIEKTHELKKYDWQKPHQSNLTGTEKAYYPNKDKDGIKKKYSSWKQ